MNRFCYGSYHADLRAYRCMANGQWVRDMDPSVLEPDSNCPECGRLVRCGDIVHHTQEKTVVSRLVQVPTIGFVTFEVATQGPMQFLPDDATGKQLLVTGQ